MRPVPLLLIAALASACGPEAEGPERSADTAVRVTTVTVAKQRLPRTFEAGGVIEARTTAVLSSRLVASVRERRVAAGDRVRAGQPLVLLDSRDLDAARRRAFATVTAEEQAMRAAEADRDAAAAALALATASHARISQLHERRAATAQELDAAVESLRTAEARRASAESRVAAAAAGLEASRAGAAAAGVTASFAVIAAPFDGLVTETMVDPGDLASPGAPLVRVEDTSRFRLEVAVDESWIDAVDADQPVDILLDEEGHAAGRIVEIARTVNAASHSFGVKVELPPAPRLRSGMFARARFYGAARDALVIPREALVIRGQLPTVYVVDAGRARERVLRVNQSGDAVEVTAGLQAGEQVIVRPPASLRDGDRVDVASGGGSR